MKKSKRYVRICAALLCAVLCLSVNVAPAMAAKVTQADIDALKGNAASLDKKQKEIQSKLNSLKNDKAAAVQKKTLLDDQIANTNAKISNTEAQISDYNALISQAEAELADAQQREEAQYELFCKRVREMEEQGEVSYWSILFSSDDFSDLLDNFMMVEEIMDYDNQVMNELIAVREQIEADKTALETARQEQKDAKAEQEAAKAELKSQQSQVDALITEISGQESQVKAAEAKLQAAANAADAEIRAAEKELASQIANVPSESGFLWPLPGRYNLSSLYGSRKHPVTGKANNHTGIDVPAPSGTSILACKSGVVTTSTYNNSYGNYVVVSHSDGTSTLYAHMNSRNATVGQTVSQGQVIGYVGTTGSSTGNHLHFEVRVNGSRVDPVDYFPDMTLYVRSGGRTVLLEH